MDSTTEASERSSAESRITFLSPPPAPRQVTNTPPSESESESEPESEYGEEDNMDDSEEEQEEEEREGEMEEEGEGELEMEGGENGPKIKEAPAMSASPTVANATVRRTTIDYMSFKRAVCRELYGERDFAMGVMLESSMYQRRAVFQGPVNQSFLPPLSGDQMKILKQKWIDQEIRELEAISARLAWLQEYCEICAEELKRGRGRY